MSASSTHTKYLLYAMKFGLKNRNIQYDKYYTCDCHNVNTCIMHVRGFWFFGGGFGLFFFLTVFYYE